LTIEVERHVRMTQAELFQYDPLEYINTRTV